MTNKVDVLTVEDVNIKRFRWWSNWVDVAVFNYGGYGWLLQIKISRTNKKKFNAVEFKGGNTAPANTAEAGNLQQMSSDKE